MTGQFVVDSLKLIIGYVEHHPVWMLTYIFFGGGLPALIRVKVSTKND